MNTKVECNGTGPDHDTANMLLISDFQNDMITPYEFELLRRDGGVKSYKADDEDSMVEVVSVFCGTYQLYAYCKHDYKGLLQALESERRFCEAK